MPQMLRIPSVEELPPGPRRKFVTELHVYFRASGRPSPARVATAVQQLSESVLVSRETVRRLLKGETTSTWPKVKAVHEVLCRMAEQDPTWRRFANSEDYDDDNDVRTLRDYLRDLWNDAVDGSETDEAPAVPPQQPASGWGGTPTSAPPADDPWAVTAPKTGGWGTQPSTTPATGYSDEPPF